MVRMSLDGVEVAAKITGAAAKEIAIFLLAALKNDKSNLKLKGRTRLTSMLKSSNSLEIFSVKESDLKSFMQGAKQYGIVYCVLRNTKSSPDGLCDIMVKADDAPKISRLVERLKLATVEKATIESEIVLEKVNKTIDTEPRTSNVDNTEKLLDDLLGTEKKESPPKEQDSRPFADSPPKTRQSETTSENKSKSAKGIPGKPSVKEEIREIAAAIKSRNADAPQRGERSDADKLKNTPVFTMHKQPSINNKIKFKNTKERF